MIDYIEVFEGEKEIIEVSSARGRSATIAIGTITTGAAGTNASVTNVGTSGEAVFNFTIPMGDTVELRISGGYLQWKNTTAATWTNILEIADITATIDIGTVTTGDPDTDVLVTNSGAGKDAVFNFTIPRGDSVELRIDGGYIQWKTTTATTWNNLHAVSAITPTITVGTVTTGNAGTNVAVTNSGIGKDGIFNFTIPRGDDVQLRIDSGYLQWKNTTASTWTNIVQITDITATIEVGTVTTGAAGTSVTFVNAGSGKDAIFNLSIPKGTTFTPSVSAEGVISFTNDGGLANPTSVDIKGNPAPNTIFQYSVNNIDWTTTATGAQWYRQSGDNGATWSEAIAISTTAYADAKVAESITEDVTGIAPSQAVVFDALALKADASDVADALDLKADADDVINALESAVDENIPIFDGIAGDKLKDSGVKLSDKADITSLEIEKKLLMDEIDSLKKASIENSNAPYLTVSDYGDVALAKNSVGVGTVGVDGVTVENLVTNGDFSNGTTGWGTVTTPQIANNICTFTATGVNGRIEQNISGILAGETYAVFGLVKANSNQVSLRGTDLTVGGVTVAHSGSGNFELLIGMYTQTLNKTISFRVVDARTSGWAAIQATGLKCINLTAHGLASLTEAQLAKLLPVYFDGKKTFGGVGCLVSKDSAEVEVGRMYFETTPMYSNATAKDTLTYSGGKYYHTHNVDSDGVAIETPYDTEVLTNGQIVCLSEGTVTYEPWYPDIGIYTDKFTLTKAITAVKELYKYGSPDLITDAVIAEDGLSFTSASLTAGDLAYGVFEFDEPLRPLLTIKSRNDDATIADTANGKVYTFRPVITNGAIASWTVTEV